MSTVERGPSASGMVQRIRELLLKPDEAWARIDAEPATIGGLYRSWVIPLALIGPVCGLIGSLAFGHGLFGVTYRPSPVGAVIGAAIGYGVQLAMVFVLAMVIEALAPTFGGQKDRVQAFKLAAYSGTAGWLAGVFQLFPPLAFLGLLGLYSLWLLFKGLPVLMKTPAEKAVPYTALIVVIAVVVGLIIGAITAPLAMMGGRMGSMMESRSSVSGDVTLPGGGKLDIGELERAAKQMESGKSVAAVDPEGLKAYLPAAVAGFVRSQVSSGSGGAAGLSGSGVEGVYAKGEASLNLSITDLGSAAPLAAMAGALNVRTSKETNGAYEKAGKVDGRMTFEKFDGAGGHGEYGVLVGDRFLVQATGEKVGMNELKAAVGAVDARALEGLAKG